MLFYRVMPDIPIQLALFVAELLAAPRRQIGTRRGIRGVPARARGFPAKPHKSGP